MAGGKRDEQAHPSNEYDRPSNRYDPVQEEETDHTNPGMLNMDLSNGSADGQEEDAGYAKKIKRTLACSEFGIGIGIGIVIGIVISSLVFGCAYFRLRRLVSSNHQQDAKTYTCPTDWIGYQEHCFIFSKEEKTWKESQNFCMSHNASLAKITKEEMDFVKMHTRDHVFWIYLIKEPNQPWKWQDGENATLKVLGDGGDRAYLNDDGTASSGRSTTEHRFICKKKKIYEIPKCL